MAITPSTPEVPYFDFSTLGGANLVAYLFYSHRYIDNVTSSGATGRAVTPNHMVVIGASQTVVEANCGTQLGDTLISSGANYTFIWQQRIEQGSVAPLQTPPRCTGRRLRILNESAFDLAPQVLTHETVHQWLVNHGPAPFYNDATGHCNDTSYKVPADICLMNTNYPPPSTSPQVPNHRMFMHYLSRGGDSEYTFIRSRLEPIPQP